jgi:hypothetical protein
MNARCDVAQPSRLRVPVASRDADCPATTVRRDAAPTRRRGRLRYGQRRLVAELDALKRLQAETAAELDAFLPAILDRAFKGEL